MSDEQQTTGISIVQETEVDPPAQEGLRDPQAVDPNEVLNEILQGLSGLQAVMGMFDARIAQLEKLTGYLLQKDPEFMANLAKSEAAAKEHQEAQRAANEGSDGKAEG